MLAVIVAGSDLDAALDAAEAGAADLVVAVDGGAERLACTHIVPDLLIGDMDSVSDATRRDLEGQGVEVISLPATKDETDTEAALRVAAERGADTIVVHGALGGPRLDHLVGNLLLLTSPHANGRSVRLVDAKHEVFLARCDVSFEGAPGDTVSLLPLTPEVEEIVTEGLAYPLRGESLLQSSTRGVSNSMLSRHARVRHGRGTLLVIHYSESEG